MSIATDEGGFTLIELIITIIITGIITVSLASATISIIHNSSITTQTLSQSHDAQIAAAYFANDVQSADNIDTTDTGCDQGGTSIVRLAWTEFDAGGNPTTYKVADYVTQGGALHRHFCQGSTSNPTTLSDALIAYNAISAVTSTATCTDASGNVVTKTIALTVTEQAPPAAPYTFQVSGVRREATC